MQITLRDVADDDIALFFAHQLDETAQQMAAFIAKDPTDQSAFEEHWAKIRTNDAVIIKTIEADQMVAGWILSYVIEGEREMSYWIDRAYWGRGIATGALKAYLSIVDERPLFARVAKHNIGSQRVLKKCGFKTIGEDKGFANAQGHDVEEYILKLDAG